VVQAVLGVDLATRFRVSLLAVPSQNGEGRGRVPTLVPPPPKLRRGMTYEKLKDVTIGGQLGELFHDGTTYLARYPAEGLFMVLTSHDEQRLRLYCDGLWPSGVVR
jgi:hypothetical protein